MERSRVPQVAEWAHHLRAVLTAIALSENRVRGVAVGGALYASAVASRYLFGLEGFAFLTFFPAISLSALAGGAVVGAGFAVLSGFTAWFLFIAPAWSFEVATAADGLAILAFSVVAAIEVLLMDQLSAALREADAARARAADALDAQRVMFLEFQHRVANGLQSAASLLAVERRRLEAGGDADPAETLGDAARRLQAMARLHRRLYDPDTAQSDFRGIVEEVCQELKIAFGAEAVTVEVDVPPRLPIGVDRLLPLALLVAEAVTNSFKHGFSDGRAGTIQVRLSSAGGTYELVVRDDGPGLPDRPAGVSGRESLGMLVLQSLAQRIGGRLELTSEEGAVTRLVYPATGAAA